MTIERIIELVLGQVGAIVILILLLVGGHKGYWFFGWYVKELRDRINEQKTTLERYNKVSTSATRSARILVEREESNHVLPAENKNVE